MKKARLFANKEKYFQKFDKYACILLESRAYEQEHSINMLAYWWNYGKWQSTYFCSAFLNKALSAEAEIKWVFMYLLQSSKSTAST